MNNNTITANKDRELNNTVINSLKFLEKLLGNIINHTETIYTCNMVNAPSQEDTQENLANYVNHKLQGIMQLFKEKNNEHYCDLIAKTANNETFSINDLISQFKHIEWLTNGYHALETKLIDSPNFEQGISAANNLLLQHLASKITAFYLINNNNTLKLLHQSNIDKNIVLPKTITKDTNGFNMLLETNYTYLGATPDELITNDNKEYYPKYLFSMPIMMNNIIEGMLLLGKDSPFTSIEKKFLTMSQTHLAAFLNYTRTNNQLVTMQDTINGQNKTLKIQAEELSSQKEVLTYHRARAEALEKKTVTLNNALNQKNQIIETTEEKIDTLNQSLANKTKNVAILEKSLELKSQELSKFTEKANTLEKQLLEKNQRIEALNEKLSLAEKTAAAQNIEIDALNSELHQVNAIIKKQTEVLNATNSKADYLEYLAKVIKTTINDYLLNSNEPETQQGKEELLRLIEDIQELSNIQNNNITTQIIPTSLAEIFASLKQQFAPIASNKGLAFSIEQSNDIANYQKTDPSKLQKILHSLLAYSFQSTDIGAIQLKAYRPEHANNKNLFAIAIADTGAGLPTSQQNNIFGSFNTENFANHRSTGLALKLAYEYAKLLSAELQVKSQEGLGTTFTLYLPMATCNVDDLHATYKQNLDTQETIANFTETSELATNKLTPAAIKLATSNISAQNSILIMHDDNIHKNINKLLKSVVKTTDFAATADMAYKKIKATTFNCLIISLQHPDLPGFKWLISQLKREGLTVPPCVLYVPYTMNTRENELAKKYLRDYGVTITKNTDELLEEVIHNLCIEPNECN